MWEFLLKKGAGILSGFVSQWRIYSFIIVIVGGYVATLKFKTFRTQKKLTSAQESIALKDVEIAVIKLSNTAYLFAQSELVKANRQCVLNNLANQRVTNQALEDLQDSTNQINNKYEKLKNNHVNSVCGNTLIDIELL